MLCIMPICSAHFERVAKDVLDESLCPVDAVRVCVNDIGTFSNHCSMDSANMNCGFLFAAQYSAITYRVWSWVAIKTWVVYLRSHLPSSFLLHLPSVIIHHLVRPRAYFWSQLRTYPYINIVIIYTTSRTSNTPRTSAAWRQAMQWLPESAQLTRLSPREPRN